MYLNNSEVTGLQILQSIMNMNSSEVLVIKFNNKPDYRYIVKKERI